MKRVSVLLADPPWDFRNAKTGGSHTSGAGQQYRTLDQDALERLPVGSVLGALVLVMAGSMVAVGLVAVYGAFLRWSNEDEAEAGRERARPAMPGPKSVRRKVS